MGTHFHDQPPELWAAPVSLDPTPVWKQYILVAVLLALSLVLIGVVSYVALLPNLVTPPAVVPGGRVVLARSAVPAVGGQPVLVAANQERSTFAAGTHIGVDVPLDEMHSFWLSQPKRDQYVAVLARWSPGPGEPACAVTTVPPFTAPVWSYSAECPAGAHVEGSPVWGPQGEPIAAPRSLARYLVSVGSDRIIVNVSDVIREYGATPQPRVAPLSTP